MAQRYGIQFYPCGQIYYFTSPDMELSLGTPVVVDTGHGENLGRIIKIVNAAQGGVGRDASEAQPEEVVVAQGDAVGGEAEAYEAPEAEEVRLEPGEETLAEAAHEDPCEEPGETGEQSECEGQELSEILSEALNPDSPKLTAIRRVAGPRDLERAEQNIAFAAKAGKYCKDCATEHRLDMKLVHTEVSLDGGKLIFFFTAPGRIDFRELVKALARNFHARIELRQIGVRHETQIVGAIGNCGMVCCCRRYMRKFAPVTIKMAKEQGLFLNPVKISGTCGRLLCCLSFEQHNYEEFHGRCPKLGKKYETDKGVFKVLRASLFRNSLSLLPEMGGDELEVTLEEWRDMHPTRFDNSRRQREEKEARAAGQGAPDKEGDARERRASERQSEGGERDNAGGERGSERGGNERGGSERGGNERGGNERGGRKRPAPGGKGPVSAAEDKVSPASGEKIAGETLVEKPASEPKGKGPAENRRGEPQVASTAATAGLSRFLAAASGDDGDDDPERDA